MRGLLSEMKGRKQENYTITPQTNLSTQKRVGREGKQN